MERWKEFEQFLLKKIKVVFFDGEQVSIKIGKLTGYDQNFLYISTSNSQEAVAVSKIVRIELMEDEK